MNVFLFFFEWFLKKELSVSSVDNSTERCEYRVIKKPNPYASSSKYKNIHEAEYKEPGSTKWVLIDYWFSHEAAVRTCKGHAEVWVERNTPPVVAYLGKLP
jgi:hypothetical protein